KEALTLCDRHGLVATRGLVLANLAEVGLKTNDAAAAETYARGALEGGRAGGNRALACTLNLLFAHLALRRGDRAAARSDLAAALDIAISVGRPSLQLAGVSSFADLLEAQGELECARNVLSYAAEHPATLAVQRDELRARLTQLR